MREEEIVSYPKKKNKKKKHKEADNSNDPIEAEEPAIDPKTYLPPMLKLKTVLNLKNMLKRMIHLRFEKKKYLTSVRSTPEKTSLQEDTGRKENHGCRNPCPFQVSLSKPKKKSTTTSFVNG